MVDKPLTAWTLSRRFRLGPSPAPGEAAEGDRLEIAWDGHRVLACCARDEVRLFSGDWREWTKELAPIVAALRKLRLEAVIEGFACALGEDGKPSFEALRGQVARKKPSRLVFAAWDLLFEGGEDLTSAPLRRRAERLGAVLGAAKDPVVLSQPLEGAVSAVMSSVTGLGMRGIVCRDLDAPYGRAARCTPVGDAPLAWDRSLSAPPAVTNATKVLYPRDGFTKTDVVAYYADVAEPLLRLMRDRPVVCQRWPDGIDDFTWYQHRMPPRAPDYLRAVWIDSNRGAQRSDSSGRGFGGAAPKRERRVVIESAEGLAWMVNQAALTFHGWSSRVAALTSPDWAILDLDPGESTRWETVIQVALAVRKVLEMLDLPSVPKTSGQKGLHVLVPIAPGHTPAQTHELARGIATLVARLYPNEVSLEAQVEARRGRLYLDHLQHFTGKSLVLPYSLRATDGAPASAPLLWSEVTPALTPRAFSLRTMRERLDRVGDLALALTQGTARLAPALARLSGSAAQRPG